MEGDCRTVKLRPWTLWLRLPNNEEYAAHQGISVNALCDVIRVYANPKATNVRSIRIDFAPEQDCPADVL